jgi:secreted protein with Ig-like and vWFA domain
MKIDANDSKWTAYALGEIRDLNERAEIESILEKSPEMRRLIDEIRDAANLLTEQLRTEPSMGLTPAQLALIEQKANRPGTWFGFRPVWAIACAAAAIALISFLTLRQLPHIQPTPQPVQIAKTTVAPENPVPVQTQEIKQADAHHIPAVAPEKKKALIEKPDAGLAPTQPAPEPSPVQVAESRPPEPPVTTTPSFSGRSWLGGPSSGSIKGTIKDSSGGVVPGAGVALKNTDTNGEAKTKTDNTGTYNIAGLLPGNYDIYVEKEGFATQLSKDIRVGVGDNKVDAKLEPGKKTDVVEVNIKAENIVLDNGPSVGIVLPQDQISKLPLVNSNVLDLVKVMGGVIMTDAPIFSADQTTLQGLSANNVNVQTDGVTANNIRWQTDTNTPTNLEPSKVSEFKVKVSPVDAELGRGSGQIQVVTPKAAGAEPATINVKNASASGMVAPSPVPTPVPSTPSTGGGVGTGRGVGSGPGSGGGMGGGFGGGIGGGTAGFLPSFAIAATMAPPPPPPPIPMRRRDRDYSYEMPPPYPPNRQYNDESYDRMRDNPFADVVQNPLSTFSIDVDTASYSNMRRFLDRGSLPPRDSIRIEELVNYFHYDYKGPSPKDTKPFAVNFELTEAPWKTDHLLLRIGIKGRDIESGKRPPSNLVFLLDVSGSMGEPNKLPLVKQSMRMLLDNLTENDKVAIVIYREETSILLPSTNAYQKGRIAGAIDSLDANGTTNGAAGIQLAYQVARENFIKGGTNRVILATDGDFNTGMTNREDLTRLIEDQARTGIFFTGLGFGMGNLKDATLEMLSNKGRGNYAYIDTLDEARKVLQEQANATLVPIAKDVKIQVEFNPSFVSSYRLIGYEDKILAKEDFNNDAKMASVIGAGHTVTALYELVPADKSYQGPGVDPLKYQKPAQPAPSANGNEMLTLKIRSKEPSSEESVLSVYTVKGPSQRFIEASQDFKFASAVAAFGMILRYSPYKGDASFESVLQWAREGKGIDKNGYREEFIRLVYRASSLRY